MHLEARIARSMIVSAPPAAVLSVLKDVPDSTAHFPTLLSLVAEQGGFTWSLASVRVKGVSVKLTYGCRYTRSGNAITWQPVEGVGNSAVSGLWRVTPSGSGSQIELENHLVFDLSLPRLLRPLAAPALEKNHVTLIEGYMANLSKTFNGQDGRLRAPMR